MEHAVISVRIQALLAAAFVYRQDVLHWPHVRDGLHTPEHAIAVFEQMFDARPPPAVYATAEAAANALHTS